MASAILFLVGAATFGAAGVWRMALAGIAGALLAVLVIVLFSGRNRPPLA